MKKLLPSIEIENLLNDKPFLEVLSYLNKIYNIDQKCIIYVKSDNIDHFKHYSKTNVYKIIYVDSGEVEYLVDEIVYKAKSGDFILIPPNTSHKLLRTISDKSKRIIIVFDDNYISYFNTVKTDLSLIFKNITYSRNHQITIRSAFKNRIDSHFSLLEELYLSNDYGDDVLFNTTFISLIVRMNKGVNFSDVDNYYKNYGNFLKKINQYIDNNIDSKILLSDIANHIGLSESRLSHLFKEYLGTSVLQYIINKRLTIARDMLKIGTSLNDVCSKCGFQDYSSFIRTFKKKFNISPKAYQKQYYKQQ